MSESYTCPQCSGKLDKEIDDNFVCENCGLNMTQVLENVSERDGPLEDVANQLVDIMDSQKRPLEYKDGPSQNGAGTGGIDWDG